MIEDDGLPTIPGSNPRKMFCLMEAADGSDPIAALRASHARLRAALENLEPWWGGHDGTKANCPICRAIGEARAALASARLLSPEGRAGEPAEGQ